MKTSTILPSISSSTILPSISSSTILPSISSSAILWLEKQIMCVRSKFLTKKIRRITTVIAFYMMFAYFGINFDCINFNKNNFDKNNLGGINIGFDVNSAILHASESKQSSVFSKSKLRLSGFGTISHTFDDRDDLKPFRDISCSGVESQKYLKQNSDWRLDSRLGIQADYQFSQQTEFVIQGVLKDRANPTLIDSIELAYFGFRPLPKLDLRAGRISYAPFLMSDIRETGYAYLWARPPVEFYSRIPLFFIDGADAAYNFDQGDVQWRVQLQYGKKKLPLSMGTDHYDFETNNLSVFSITRQSGALRLKAGYSFFTSENEINAFIPLNQGLEAVAAATAQAFPDISDEAMTLREETTFEDNDVSYYTVGFAYDDFRWVAQGEFSLMRASGDVLPNGYAGYFSLGYRFGDFTPYILFGSIEPYTDLHEPSANWDVIGYGGLQSSAIYLVNSTRMEQHSNSLGLRWDFDNQAAIKLQWDNIHIDPYGYGLWHRKIELLPYSNEVNLYSFSLEFFF